VVRAVAGTEPLVESEPSPEACVSVRDVFAPAPPTGVAALAAGGVVDVSWSPSTEADLASYRVYRSDGGEARRLAEVPSAETRFRDETAAIGPTYNYTVTAVDRDGNESAPSAPARARPL
jgi:fibronectin type 3 domain-containing protein